MRAVRCLSLLALALLVITSPAMGRCSINLHITQTAQPPTGNIWTDSSRGYGGWFWMAGYGNNLINVGSGDAEAGVDSGLRGGVPLGTEKWGASWLVDPIGDGSMRTVMWDWWTSEVDGCGDLNGNTRSDADEVLAVLVVDDRGEEYALISVAGGGVFSVGWDLARVNNGVASAFGGTNNGVPMTPIPRPTLGVPTQAAAGRVNVSVTPPPIKDIPTYDELGGARLMVQGFHILQNDLLLAEIGASGLGTTVKANPGETLVLRTIFGYPGDAGFYVDSSVTVPQVGEEPEPAPDVDTASAAASGASSTDPAAADPASTGVVVPVVVGTVIGQGDDEPTDLDEDEIFDDEDNCPEIANPEQEDMDEDGVGDFCDSCPFDSNEDQNDGDDDGLGDLCDPCPVDPDNLDVDGDGACDAEDNCPDDSNFDQRDSDGDGAGDLCDDSFEPYVLELELPGSAATRGAKLDIRLAVTNRGADPRSAMLRLLWVDAQGVETEVGVAPDCLEASPLELNLESGDSREWNCSWAVPSSLGAGKGRLRLELKDGDDAELRESAESGLTLR